jgi:hypothetical protein
MDQQTYDMGIFFGYPECCIKWFSEERTEKALQKNFKISDFVPLTKQQEAVHNFHGFIPCPVCAEKVTSDTIGTLIQNRKCQIPYPNG